MVGDVFKSWVKLSKALELIALSQAEKNTRRIEACCYDWCFTWYVILYIQSAITNIFYHLEMLGEAIISKINNLKTIKSDNTSMKFHSNMINCYSKYKTQQYILSL